jgi:S-DNA-T family DNA segregation ATPase FtsK/SpoIIIE
LKLAKKKPRNDVLLSALRWMFGFAGTLYLSWLLLFPSMSGDVGRWLSGHLCALLGFSAYALPLLLLNGLLQFIRNGRKGLITNVIASLSVLFSTAWLLALASGWMSGDPAIGGGTAGKAVSAFAQTNVGGFGAWAFGLGVLLFSLQLVFGIRWSQVAVELSALVTEDYRQWQKSRQELSLQLERSKPSPESKPVNVNAPPPQAAPAPPAPAVKPVVVKEIKEPSPKPSKAAPPRDPAPAPADSPYAHYKLPPIDLLNLPPQAKDTGKPSEDEIAGAIAELERTLKSFDIDAKVTGYAPGPVITRYELSPAPGVKVSSIVALENDIALAMKAKGIRIIAPIPGKAAVGIEIPNQRPALVVLREILESPALPPEAPLLSFALGLSSSGAPLAADVQRMPHVLIAGATNSGKSVTIHTLILSILFRARPDEVKFLMIDPKRLELSFYDGIPHLFNPTTSADKVQVVTNPKDAAKSLLALVKLMERRYEEFQLFGVRNIDSYNREAAARGKPRAYFIVVVIDELADLMLIAADTVEDSIQRLTQMARAVGIHLVLATQRPSVDVITGVIKANLPSRIALQVISKVDSKVILDCTGAESLQGKGDLLYLAAGSQKPERCQGAYVAEDEISKVVAYLRSQGKPDYPLLETMAKGGDVEADLASFGVDPLEFSQALKLVLERRRVSQDLLKSQFGSSARATNILSALEVKELIFKPEGSNRWDIHFDQIEDYMRKHFPQVPLDTPNR